MINRNQIPNSWSELTWQQLCQVWYVKQRYGGNADVARSAALLGLVSGSRVSVSRGDINPVTGEQQYNLGTKSERYIVTPRELAWLSKKAMPWFDYPYGDQGDAEQKDEKGVVVKEYREGVRGYVSTMRDTMILPAETIKIGGRHFALPQLACNNLTWQQYRSLQNITPELFSEDIDEEQALSVQSQFLAYILTPRSIALLDTSGGSIRIRLHYEYRYDPERVEELEKFWRKRLVKDQSMRDLNTSAMILFHICFQTYQTAISYYAASYPLLFEGSDKKDPLRDALTGEVGTINTIMKYAGYSEQQQVYDSNLPFVLDILNTMTKEAKEIEKMNARIKKH